MLSKPALQDPSAPAPLSRSKGSKLSRSFCATLPGSSASPPPSGRWSACRRGEFGGGHNRRAGLWGDDSLYAQEVWCTLGASEAVDQLSRSRVRKEKGARDRLIRFALSRPGWALGFEDETWWSRFERPSLHGWAEARQPIRLLEKEAPKEDPDPKALAAYGMLVRTAG